jgi:hypothetical protein
MGMAAMDTTRVLRLRFPSLWEDEWVMAFCVTLLAFLELLLAFLVTISLVTRL